MAGRGSGSGSAAVVFRGEINPTQRMESLQKGYLQAICAAAGCSVLSFDIDDGIDAMIKHRSSSHWDSVDRFLQIQLKSTYTHQAGDSGAVGVQFSRARYDLFAETDPTIPKIVVIMIQPQNPEDWLRATHNQLEMRHCSYWVNIAGKPTTAENPTVSASREAIFDDIALATIMTRIGQGGVP